MNVLTFQLKGLSSCKVIDQQDMSIGQWNITVGTSSDSNTFQFQKNIDGSLFIGSSGNEEYLTPEIFRNNFELTE